MSPNHSTNTPTKNPSATNSLIDKVYVLSVKTFDERIVHIKEEMHKHGIDFKFVFTHDIPDLLPELLSSTFGECQLSMAQKSLVLKHISAWRDAAEKNHQRILIFEDDAVLHVNFSTHLAKVMLAVNSLKPGYLIFLGGADAKVPDRFLLSKEVIVPLPMSTTEGYITDLTAIKRRMSWLASNKVMLPADHLLCKIDTVTYTEHYWSRMPMVEQGSVTGIFTSALDSHRQKHNRLFNVIRYRWNKLQRHVLKRWIAHFRNMFIS